MKNTLDILHVTFDKSPTDETVMSVAKVVNGKIYVLKMELGEQADILYRLLTEKTAKVEIKAESKEQDTISRQEVLKYFEGWKNQVKYYHPYAKNFDIPYEEAIQMIKDVPPVKCVSLEKPNKCEDAISADVLNHWIGAEVLDSIRAEIDQYLFQNEFGSEYRKEISQIIDKYKAEGSSKE